LDLEVERDRLIRMYRRMLDIRNFEQRAVELFTAGRLPGFLHSALGEEAVPVGVCANLRTDDYITSTHRGHADVIAKGARLDRMMAELFAKETGYCRAKGGSMHVADFSQGIIGAMGIVGSGVPIAVGAALSAKLRKSDQVAVCFFGDGATCQGAFHEGMNLASIWRLPVVFVCVNNHYAMSTPHTYHQTKQVIAERAQAYNIPAATVDGNDVLAVFEAGREAVERTRSGGGPSFLECITYRWMGHYIGDPGVYRQKEEVAEWMERRDPIPRFRKWLSEQGMTEAELSRAEESSRAELEDAVRYAESSPEPREEEALEDLFV